MHVHVIIEREIFVCMYWSLSTYHWYSQVSLRFYIVFLYIFFIHFISRARSLLVFYDICTCFCSCMNYPMFADCTVTHNTGLINFMLPFYKIFSYIISQGKLFKVRLQIRTFVHRILNRGYRYFVGFFLAGGIVNKGIFL